MINRSIQILASSKLGGGELVGIDLAHRLKSMGLSSMLMIPGYGEAVTECQARELQCKVFKFANRTHGFFRELTSLLRLGLFVRRNAPAIVHVHSPSTYGAISVAIPQRCLKVVHIHSSCAFESLSWCFKRPPNKIICCANFMRELVCFRLGIPVDNELVCTFLNAIDLERFNIVSNSSRLVLAKPRIIMIANLSQHKGQEIAIRALQYLKRNGCLATLQLCGEDREGLGWDSYLSKLTSELGLRNQVEFLGFRKDIPELLKQSDFLLLPSKDEGLPLSVLEAQACGVVVLASPVGGIPEIIVDGKTGYLVSPNEPTQYALRILQLCAEPSAYARIANEALAQVRGNHNWDNYVSNICQLYRRLMNPLRI